jgi:hypothetical protein
VDNCVLKDSGSTALYINGGTNNTVRRCHVSQIGTTGISVSGGDRVSLTEANHLVEECTIHNFSQWRWTYQPGIRISGVGLTARNNEIYDAPHSAILFGGNENIIEKNNIHGVCQYSSDAGAIYGGRDWGARGIEIRNNFVHHISSNFEGLGAHGIYLDDCLSGILVHGNILYEIATYGVLHGGGRDDIIENNIFVHCEYALSSDSRGLTRITNTAGDSWNLREKLEKLNYQSEPWASRYPECAAIPNSWTEISAPDALWKYPENSVFSRNLGFENTNWSKESNGSGTGTFNKFAEIIDNVEDEDPLFVDEANLNLALTAASPVNEIPGFEPIPFSEIGVTP